MKRKFSSIFFYILTLVSIFGFNSCADHINEPVKEFFKEYTETAQVSRYELSQSPVMDSNGSQNVTSNQDLTIYYYLINPQQYTLNTQLKKAAEEGFSETRSITQSEDKYILSYFIPKADLKTMELAGGSFSPSLRLIEEFTRRDFGIYPIALKVNTPPPQVLSITFYKNSSNCYVIYFNLPGTNQTNSSKIHKDLNALKINGNTFPLSVGIDGIITFAEGSGVKPCTAIDTGHTAYITGLDFVPSKDASIAQSFYYVTDVQTKEKDSTVYSFTLTDRLGLSTVTNGSPTAEKLGNALIYCGADIVADGASLAVNSKNQTTIAVRPQAMAGSFVTSNATVNYIIERKEEGGDFTEVDYGSQNGGIEVTLTSGVYRITTTVSQSGLTTSDTTQTTFTVEKATLGTAQVLNNGVEVADNAELGVDSNKQAKITIKPQDKTGNVDTRNATVAYKIERLNKTDDGTEGYQEIANGSGSYTGSKDFTLETGTYRITTSVTMEGLLPSPEKTVTFNVIWKEKVTVNATSIDDIRTAFNNGTDKDIDIEITTLQTFEMGKDNFAALDIPTGSNVKIKGLEFNISNSFASATTSDKYSVINIPSGSSLTLENCTLTGTSFLDAGGTAITNKGELTIKNTTISGFVSNDNGAGINNYGTVTMESGLIESNKARYGAAVYQTSNSAVFNMQGGTITGNNTVNGSIIDGSGTFNWSGGEIKNNPANDIFGSNVTVNNTSGNTAS